MTAAVRMRPLRRSRSGSTVCRAAALKALAAPVAVADLCGQGWVLAAPVIGLAGGDPLAGLAIGGEPAAADVEVAG